MLHKLIHCIKLNCIKYLQQSLTYMIFSFLSFFLFLLYSPASRTALWITPPSPTPQPPPHPLSSLSWNGTPLRHCPLAILILIHEIHSSWCSEGKSECFSLWPWCFQCSSFSPSFVIHPPFFICSNPPLGVATTLENIPRVGQRWGTNRCFIPRSSLTGKKRKKRQMDQWAVCADMYCIICCQLNKNAVWNFCRYYLTSVKV